MFIHLRSYLNSTIHKQHFHQIECLAFDWVCVRMRCLLKVAIKLIHLHTNKNNQANPNPTNPQPNHKILVCCCIYSTLLWLKHTAYEAKGQLYICCSIICGHVHVQKNFWKCAGSSMPRSVPPLTCPSASRPCHARPTHHQPFVTPVKELTPMLDSPSGVRGEAPCRGRIARSPAGADPREKGGFTTLLEPFPPRVCRHIDFNMIIHALTSR